MDALQMLRDDHLKVKDLFRRFDEAADGTTRKAIVDEAIAELMIHSQLEEEVFYPAMEREGLPDLVRHSEEEHAAADRIMVELSSTDSRDKTLEPRFRLLVETVTEHITDEESQMFPRAAELPRDRLSRIGDQMAALKERLTGAAQATRSPAATTSAGPMAVTRRTARKRTTAKRATAATSTTRKRTTTKRATAATNTTRKRTTTKRAAAATSTARKRTTTKRPAAATSTARKRTTTKRPAAATSTARKRTTTKRPAAATSTARKRNTAKSAAAATRRARKVTSAKRPAPGTSRPAAGSRTSTRSTTRTTATR
ncbi:MAG: hemerythrin domain-containing protein [Dehalococcoidia bacterium]